jgi:WD40 repeat protein
MMVRLMRSSLVASIVFFSVVSFTHVRVALGQRDAYPSGFDNTLIVEPPQSLGPRLSRIAAILVEQCLGCHNDQQAEGGYSMATPDSMWRPGESKRLPIIRDADAWGELVRRITSAHPDERMPKDAPPLDPESIDAICDWLAYGARVDGATDAPIESFVVTPLNTEPSWISYPKPLAVSALEFDLEGKVLFSSGASEVLAWSLQGKLLARIPVRGRFISDIEWNASNNSLYVVSGTPGQIGTVESVPWSQETGRTEEGARLVHWVARDVPLDIALSPAGDRLATGLLDGMVLVQASNSNSILWKVATHAAAVTSLDWSADGKQLLSSSRDRTAKCLDASNGDVITSFVDHERTVASLRSLSMGCFTMDEAGVLRFYPGGTASRPASNRKGFAQRTPKLASDRDQVLVPVEGGVLRFRVHSKEVEYKDKEGNDKKKTEWSIDEDPRLAWTASDSGEPDAEIPLSLAFSGSEGGLVAVGLADGRILVWDREGSQPRTFLNRVLPP